LEELKKYEPQVSFTPDLDITNDRKQIFDLG